MTGDARVTALVDALRARAADCAARAVPDRELAEALGVHERLIIDLAEAATKQLGVAVIAGCGAKDRTRRGKGRWIEADPKAVRLYGEALHERAKAIHGRGRTYTDAAAAMEAGRAVETSGQRRLFA